MAVTFAVLGAAPLATAQSADPPAKVEESSSEGEDDWQLFSREDGWLDVSEFLDQKYGFLPLIIPITEPAVGFGAAAGLAFIDKPLGQAKAGYGRPDVTLVGGLATENGSRGAVVGDVRQWMDDRLQTVAGVVDASVNLDFHGIGDDSRLHDDPLEYTLEPLGLLVQAKYRLGDTRCWAGLGYSFATTAVEFDAPASTPGIPDFERHTDVAGFTPSFTYDSRDNVFTPTAGDYLEASVGVFSSAFGGDDEFERLRLIAMHYTTLAPTLFLGLRAEGAATFGDEPFYMDPYLSLRGAPIMRYQGEEIAQIETELRWQFYERWSLLGFAGGGAAWNDSGSLDAMQKVISGGAGFRYEVARKYGIHAGLDVAFSRDNAAIYIQIGGAWTRP